MARDSRDCMRACLALARKDFHPALRILRHEKRRNTASVHGVAKLTQQRIHVLQCRFPSLSCESVTEETEVDEVECTEELVRKWLCDVVLEERYLLDLGLVISREFGGVDVASEGLNITIADAGLRHKVTHPRACPGPDVYDPRDLGDVDSRRDGLRIFK